MNGRNEELDVEGPEYTLAMLDLDCSDYTMSMLERFVGRYDEMVALTGSQIMSWQALPLSVKKSLAGAFVHVATEIQDDMY